MSTDSAQLDTEELLHLALTASRQGQHDHAILHLKQALELDKSNAKVHYFLGAEHAQIGLYERAVQELTSAVALDPSMHTAHFQLGLLHLTSGRPSEAAIAWTPLDTLASEHPLHLFKTGLLALARDDYSTCKDRLARGISLNKFSDALNNDMQGVLDRIAEMATVPADSADTGRPDEQHILLSGYTKSGFN